MEQPIFQSNDKMLDRYIKALADLKLECDKEVIIKVSHFVDDRKIHSKFFQFLIELKVIELAVAGGIKEGRIYKWVYKGADNEVANALAVKVLGRAREFDTKASQDRRDKLKDPKYLAKQHNKNKGKNAPPNSPDADTHGSYNKNKGKIVLDLSMDEKVRGNLKFLLSTYEEKLETERVELETAQAKYNNTHEFVINLRRQLGIK